ncbi:uncharacterized protein SPPG_09107 [Spizellomyces punctatus DAOM BR117]|uniref:Zn(2)-C6 fungal-type domain-containing protein n=1 Tax=Spizellomyces punctatus (strain DAOM BR117) TaxID=645134 RepID=A0A0L0HJB3_SPIPD|nr:uncharacterized protein SPPG_09107 [Spizellomyces punctatus DAOM BR117]KND01551.1 hypothetical protein SPPG_09107 [Spizellomyces punctatus DAOM BR117]|eukprot:XP_016609590.1 hypothetical protein SPPG_09107 [Spizellomyces punctatus DAOM BR117]
MTTNADTWHKVHASSDDARNECPGPSVGNESGQSVGKRKAGATRRKACEPCRQRKRKCDGDRPICGACRVFGPPETGCFYFADQVSGPDAAKRRSPTKAKLSLPSMVDMTKKPGNAQDKRMNVKDASSSPEMATGPHSSNPSPPSRLRDEVTPPESDTLLVDGAEVSMHLIHLFFQYCGSQIPFNFLHRSSFIRTIRRQQGFLLLAMQCIASRYTEESRHADAQCADAGDRYYRRARRLVPQLYDNHSLSAVQGLLILATCSTMKGIISAAWQYVGMAVRMAHYLALETAMVEGTRFSPMQEEVRKRTWAGCLILERMVWMALDRPSIYANVPNRIRHSIPDDLWPAVWPEDVIRHPAVNAFGGEQVIFNHLRPLMVLYGRVVDFIRTDHGLKMVINYQALDAELDAWFLSLPPAMRELLVTIDHGPAKLPEVVSSDLQSFWFAVSVLLLGLQARGILRKWLLNAMLSKADQVISAAYFALDSGDGLAEGLPSMGLDRRALTGKVIHDAMQVADSESAVLQRALMVDPLLTTLTPHFTMGVYQVALVYVMALGAASIEGNEATTRRCKSGLAVHEQALRAFTRSFAPAVRIVGVLTTLRGTAENGGGSSAHYDALSPVSSFGTWSSADGSEQDGNSYRASVDVADNLLS